MPEKGNRPVEHAIPEILERAEHYIYVAAGFTLVLAGAGLLISAIIEMTHEIYSHNYALAMIRLLDRVLLVLMVAEIIYTIGRITRTQMLEVEPFLIVGIIAAVRRMLIITAETVGQTSIDNPKFVGILVELGVLALIIFLIAVAMRILQAKKTVS